MKFTAQQIVSSFLTITLSISLQGCDIAKHTAGNWETQISYLTSFQYVPPGQDDSAAVLNSCANADHASAAVCSGHGQCQDWFGRVLLTNFTQTSVSFCKCDNYWADPEFRTQRKSQATAFLWSMFLGMFGADQFYLGFKLLGSLKLMSLGGLGVWWVYDMVRIGSSQVYTSNNFMVENDLPHYIFVLTAISLMAFLGFFISIRSIQTQRLNKAREVLLLMGDFRQAEAEKIFHGPGLYGATVMRSVSPPVVVQQPAVVFVQQPVVVQQPFVVQQPAVVSSVFVSPPVAVGAATPVASGYISGPAVVGPAIPVATGVATAQSFTGFRSYGTALSSVFSQPAVSSIAYPPVSVGSARSLRPW